MNIAYCLKKKKRIAYCYQLFIFENTKQILFLFSNSFHEILFSKNLQKLIKMIVKNCTEWIKLIEIHMNLDGSNFK